MERSSRWTDRSVQYGEAFVFGSEAQLRAAEPGTVTITASEGVTTESGDRPVLTHLTTVTVR